MYNEKRGVTKHEVGWLWLTHEVYANTNYRWRIGGQPLATRTAGHIPPLNIYL